MYAPQDLPLFPFATLFSWDMKKCIPQLLDCLPPEPKRSAYLEAFQNRAHVCFFPHVPTEPTRSEVERFLSDAKSNTAKCPDMLALIFAALALGSQHGVWDECGGQWVAGAVEEEARTGNIFSELASLFERGRSKVEFSCSRYASLAHGILHESTHVAWYSNSYYDWALPYQQWPLP
jgi:hypothetical protein